MSNNIYAKMSAITSEIATVAKNLQVDTGNGKGYKAVSEADVLKAVKPIEAKHGIYSFPTSRRIIESKEVVTKNKYGERTQFFLRVETVYRFVDVETGDFIDITTYGDGIDSGDKATGKAMTYADKYALLKAYKIQTGEDPDKDASEELVSADYGKKPKDWKKLLEAEMQRTGVGEVQILELLDIGDLKNMTDAQYTAIMNKFARTEDKK